MNTYWPSINSDYIKFVADNKLSFCKKCGRLQQYVPLFTKKIFTVTCFHGETYTRSKYVCSSCGELKSRSNYFNKVGLRVKTICDDCSENPLSLEITQGVQEALADFRRNKSEIIADEICILDNSVDRDVVIEQLLKLPPGARLVVRNVCADDGETYSAPCIGEIGCSVTNDHIYVL